MALAQATIITQPTAADLAAVLVADTIKFVGARLEKSGTVHVAVSGGSLGDVVLPQLVAAANEVGADWRAVHVWFADERYLARGDEERNASSAVRALRLAQDFPAEQLHTVAAAGDSESVEDSARRYHEALGRMIPFARDLRIPQFDVMLLGMGPDGHTASLFPGMPHVDDSSAFALPVHDSPKPPSQRVTLSLPVINASRFTAVYATGASKAAALSDALGTNSQNLPIARVAAAEQLHLYADAPALGNSE